MTAARDFSKFIFAEAVLVSTEDILSNLAEALTMLERNTLPSAEIRSSRRAAEQSQSRHVAGSYACHASALNLNVAVARLEGRGL